MVYNRLIALFLVFLIIGQSAFGYTFDDDEEVIITDNKHGHLESAEGFQILVISQPDSNSKSYVQLNSFDADKLLINNSRYSGNIKGFGYVRGNNLLGTNCAEEIVIEVTGSLKTNLLESIFVFGRAVDLKIINPNGIECSGCRFINCGVELEGNSIAVSNKGLASSGNIHCIASDIAVHGLINCNNDVFLSTNNSKNHYDIDISAGGRIHAKSCQLNGRRIRNLAKNTVHNDGSVTTGIHCFDGDIIFEAEDEIIQMGGLDSSSNIKLVSTNGSITSWNSTLMALRALSLQAFDKLQVVESKIIARQSYNLEARAIDINNSQCLAKGNCAFFCDNFRQNLSSIDSKGNITINTKTFDNNLGLITSSSDNQNRITISSEQMTINGGNIVSEGFVNLLSSNIALKGAIAEGEGKHDYQGSISGDMGVEINAGSGAFTNDGGEIITKGILDLEAYSFDNTGYKYTILNEKNTEVLFPRDY